RSSDSVKTSFARLNVPSSWAICWTVSTMTRLISSASAVGTVENAAVRLTSAIGPHLQDVRVRLRRVRANSEADRLAHFVLAGARCPGTCQVALRSVGVAHGEVRREVAEVRGLRVEGTLLVLPARDHFLLEHPCLLARSGYRGAPRLRRGVPSHPGAWGRSEPPCSING